MYGPICGTQTHVDKTDIEYVHKINIIYVTAHHTVCLHNFIAFFFVVIANLQSPICAAHMSTGVDHAQRILHVPQEEPTELESEGCDGVARF